MHKQTTVTPIVRIGSRYFVIPAQLQHTEILSPHSSFETYTARNVSNVKRSPESFTVWGLGA